MLSSFFPSEKLLHSIFLNLKMDIPLNCFLLVYISYYLFGVVKPLDSTHCVAYKHVNPLDGSSNCESCCASHRLNYYNGQMICSVLLFLTQCLRFLWCIFYMLVNLDQFGNRTILQIFVLQLKTIYSKVSRRICYVLYITLYVTCTFFASTDEIFKTSYSWSSEFENIVEYILIGLNICCMLYCSFLLTDYQTLAVYKTFITCECLFNVLPLLYFQFGPAPTEWVNNSPPRRALTTLISFYFFILFIGIFLTNWFCFQNKDDDTGNLRDKRN
jgi:hypothetical protein